MFNVNRGIILSSAGMIPIPTDYTAYWKMDDNSANTTVTDETTSYNGTASVNTSTISTTGVKGTANTAFVLNGTDQDIDIGSVPNSVFTNQNFSVSFWVKTSTKSNQSVIALGTSNANGGWGIYLGYSATSGGEVSYTWGNTSGVSTIRGTTDVANGTWNHIVCNITTSTTVIANNECVIYVNILSQYLSN